MNTRKDTISSYIKIIARNEDHLIRYLCYSSVHLQWSHISSLCYGRASCSARLYAVSVFILQVQMSYHWFQKLAYVNYSSCFLSELFFSLLHCFVFILKTRWNNALRRELISHYSWKEQCHCSFIGLPTVSYTWCLWEDEEVVIIMQIVITVSQEVSIWLQPMII